MTLLYMQGLGADGEVGYDRAGEVCSTLVALLKTKSTQFTTNIEKQVCPCMYNYVYRNFRMGEIFVFFVSRTFIRKCCAIDST